MRRLSVAILVLAVVAAALFLLLRGKQGGKAKSPDQVAAPGAPNHRPQRGERDRGEVDFLMEDDPQGELRLEGQVVDASEDGVGGATVVIDSNPPRSVVSEADGSFAIDKLVGRPYRVMARADAGVAGPITTRLSAKSEPVILRLRPAAVVEVTVVDAKSKEPISGATVELRGMDVQAELTDGAGIAKITPVVQGRYGLAAYAPGFATQHSWLRIAQGSATMRSRLELHAGARVSGRVSSPDGKPVEGAAVVYSGASAWAQQADQRYDSVVTDKEGKFAFTALPPGTFRFVARFTSFAPGTSELVTLDGVSTRDGVDIVLEPGARIYGKVIGETGEPRGSSRVRVAIRARGMRWSRPRETYSDDQGNYEITGLSRKTYDILALHDSGTSEIVEVALEEGASEREVDLQIDVTESIAGVVVDSEGEPIEGAQVSARPARGAGGGPGGGGRGGFRQRRLRGRQVELTDAGGRFEISGLEAGSYELSATPPNAPRSRARARLRDSVAAETGDRDVRIVLEADGKVKGKVAFANGDVPEMFSVSFGFRGGTPFSTKDGSFVLEDLPPSTYSLVVRGAGFDSNTVPDVEVKSGETSDVGTIEVRRGRTITGRVTANGSPVGGALVQAGRMIFGDGTSSKAQARMPMAQSTKESQSDEYGEFIIYGVGLGDLSIVAEHDDYGRSSAVAVRETKESISGLELVLMPFGALEGTVTKDGVAAGSARVSAQSQSVPGVVFGVATGEDGKFRLDRLAPDIYKVSAVTTSGGRHGGMGFHSTTAEVVSNQTAQVNLVIDSGEVTLLVAVKPSNVESIGFAMVDAVRGAIEAGTVRELSAATAAVGEGYSTKAFAMGSNPARLPELVPATYTVCVTPYPAELGGMRDTMAYSDREGDNMKVFCRQVEVAAAPIEQAIDIAVEVPDFVPAPAEPGSEPEEQPGEQPQRQPAE